MTKVGPVGLLRDHKQEKLCIEWKYWEKPWSFQTVPETLESRLWLQQILKRASYSQVGTTLFCNKLKLCLQNPYYAFAKAAAGLSQGAALLFLTSSRL